MSRRILWLDNDSPNTRPYVNALKSLGDEVDVVTTVSEAEQLLASEDFNLLILDVMIPTRNENEEKEYPFKQTDEGHKTGLVFYRRMKERFGERVPPVLVMTVRLDREILDEFIDAGLNRESFSTKFALRDVTKFLTKVEHLLKTRPGHRGSPR